MPKDQDTERYEWIMAQHRLPVIIADQDLGPVIDRNMDPVRY